MLVDSSYLRFPDWTNYFIFNPQFWSSISSMTKPEVIISLYSSPSGYPVLRDLCAVKSLHESITGSSVQSSSGQFSYRKKGRYVRGNDEERSMPSGLWPDPVDIVDGHCGHPISPPVLKWTPPCLLHQSVFLLFNALIRPMFDGYSPYKITHV